MALDTDFVKRGVLCLCVFAYNLGEVLRSGLRREALGRALPQIHSESGPSVPRKMQAMEMRL
jgi:hypothetical protein